MAIAPKPPLRGTLSLSTRSWVRTAIAAAVVGAVLFARRPEAIYRPQFWAEDMLFLIGAEKWGVASWWTPQAGYFQLIPRLVAWIAKFFDPALQPSIFLAGWLAVTLLTVQSCFSYRHDLPHKRLLAAALVLVPHTGEVFFNLTNAQWIAAIGLWLTTQKRDPTSHADWVADLSWIVFAGLSGPFILLALLLFVIRAMQRQTLNSTMLLAGAALVGAAQGWTILRSPPAAAFAEPVYILRLCAMASLRLPLNTFFGDILAHAARPTLILTGFGLMSLLVGQVIADRELRRATAPMLLFLAASVAAAEYRMRFDLWGDGDLINGDRYFFIPKVLLLWTSIVLAGRASHASGRQFGALLLACALAFNAPRLQFQPLPDRHWYEQCPNIRAGRDIEVTINPGWRFHYRRGSPASNGPY